MDDETKLMMMRMCEHMVQIDAKLTFIMKKFPDYDEFMELFEAEIGKRTSWFYGFTSDDTLKFEQEMLEKGDNKMWRNRMTMK